jgi:MSHA biogenesis protein MshI
MLGFLSSKTKGVQVGVDFMPTGVAVVDVLTVPNNRGLVRKSEFLPAVGFSEQSRVLQQWVDQKGLKNVDCVSLIAKHDVQQFQLEKPAVGDDELLQAVGWKIKDLINFNVDEAVVDIFELPHSSKNPASYINAVVAKESIVSSYVDSIGQSGLELQVIDVHDLVGNNFLKVIENSNQTIALLQFSENAGLLTIYNEQDLYVARDLKIGLLDMESMLQEEDDSLYENLLLELQRSMDYFESTYALGSVSKMMIFPQTPGTERMASYLQNYVGYELDFALINMQNPEQNLDEHCFAAYCAALRGIN